MREIDTEAPVVWPAWCYSGNTDESTIEVITRKGELDSDIVRQISNSTTEASGKARIRNRSANARRQARNTTAFQEGTYSEKVHYNSQDGAAQLATPPPYSLNKTLLVDKMLSDRMLVGFNVVDNNKKHCDSNPSNILFDKVKNEAQMDPAKNGELGNNNNNNSSSNNNNNNSSSNNNNNNNNGSSSNNSSSSIKRERLSPPTNGDVQSSISRSRSATPSSFPGTPPQPAHPNDLSGSSLSANILSSVQARSNEFQTRNYSDFMRSLAAKYNNNNPNDSSVQRNMLFEAKYAASKSSIKESPSPPENKRQNMPNFNPPQVANVPFVSSLLSSLPFPPAVFPPVFDMSSTQALVTLARAAKEAEIQSIIKTAQKRPAAVQSVSPSNRTSLTPTPQPASSSSVRQFSPQPFVLPGQFHQQTIQPRQPSPLSTPVSSQSTDTVPASPLDLSATQQTKRVKLEEPSSPSSSPKRDLSLHRKSPKMEIAAEQKEVSTTPVRHCQAQSEEVNCWTVDDVCEFVGSIDICAEYAKNFRDQCIDGSGLPLLTEDHLTNSLGMKLGPALKLRSILAKKLGGPCPCVSCTIITQQQQSQHLVASATAASSSTVIPSSNSSSTSSSSSLVNISQQQQGGYTASSSNNQSSTSCSNIPRPTSTDSGS